MTPIQCGNTILIALLLAAPCVAEPLSWEQSVAEAGARNAELRSARSNVEAARYRERAAWSGFLPQLSAGASHSDVSGNSATTAPPAYNASLNATQNLFAGFADRARIGQAQGSLAVSEATLDAVRARISLELKAAYTGLRYAQDLVKLTDNIVRRLEENLRLVELRYQSGRENRGSFLLTQATLAQARYENLQARQTLLTARTQLARALGRRDADALEVSGVVPVEAPGPEPDLGEMVRRTPEYRGAEAQERIAEADLTLARSGFYPSVNLTGSIAREGDDWYPDGERRSVVASISVPLFSGGRDVHGVRAAAASRAAADTGKDNVERQARVRLQQAWNGYVESDAKLRVDQAFLEAANTRAEIARSKYNNGLMTFEDWDRIENDLILRQKAMLTAQRDRVSAEAAWEQAQGKGVIP